MNGIHIPKGAGLYFCVFLRQIAYVVESSREDSSLGAVNPGQLMDQVK